jgi:hypothetical protein
MSAQESRKAYQHEFMDRTMLFTNVDAVLDMYNNDNSGQDIKDRCIQVFNELCSQYDAQFAIPASATPTAHAANHEWDVVQAKPFDWKED